MAELQDAKHGTENAGSIRRAGGGWHDVTGEEFRKKFLAPPRNQA